MAIIYSYPRIGTLDLQDLMIISDVQTEGNPTKSVTLSQLTAFIKGTPTGGLGTTNYIPKWIDGPNSILGDSPIFTINGGAGLKQAVLTDGYRFVVDRDAATTVGDPEYAITQNGVNKTSFGWDDDGGGFGFIYNWEGKGFKLGGAALYPQFEILTDPDIKNITFADFEFDADIIDITGSVGNAGEVLSSLGAGNGVQWVVNGSGTVTGTGITNQVPLWTDGPNGVLGSSTIRDTGAVDGVTVEPGGVGRLWNFSPGGTFKYTDTGGASYEFEFKPQNDGFYNPNFRFTGTLAVDRSSQATGASLDVGIPGNPIPAAWFRNGVVVSNNPSGVQVDNTSVVIGAGNNDVVSGADNCLTVGNGNQILSNSDHSVAFGLGNTISNNASASLVVGQLNTLDGTGLPAGTTARSYILGLNNSLTGSFASFIAGGSNTVTTEQNAMVLGYNNTTNGVDNVFAIGESNTLADATANGVFMIGNGITGQDGNMVIGFRNDTTGYPATNYALGLGNTKFAIGVGSVNNTNALIITEGGVNRATVTQVPRVFLPSVKLFSANTDAAADAIGVPDGGLYQNNGVVQINRGGGSVVDPLAGGGGAIGGGGNPNSIPVWTAANILGDSNITDDGALIEINIQAQTNDIFDIGDELRANGAVGNPGDVLTSDGAGSTPTWTDIGYKSVQVFQWVNGSPVAYVNFPIGTTSAIPFDTTPLVETGTYSGTAADFAWTNSLIAGGTAGQLSSFIVGPQAAGTWQIDVAQHWFDQNQFLEVNVDVRINAVANTVINERVNDGAGDRLFYGSIVREFTAGNTVRVEVTFANGTGSNPFPAATGNRPIEITFTKIV